MDISGGLLAKSVMPFGEHMRCLTCKNVKHAEPGMPQATLDLSPNENAREINLPLGNFYPKVKPLFEE